MKLQMACLVAERRTECNAARRVHRRTYAAGLGPHDSRGHRGQRNRVRSAVMPRLPGLNHQAAIHALEKAGFGIARQGEHTVMTDSQRILTILRHSPVNALTGDYAGSVSPSSATSCMSTSTATADPSAVSSSTTR